MLRRLYATPRRVVHLTFPQLGLTYPYAAMFVCADFRSKNCIRELLRAVILDRPIITIIELDRSRWRNLNVQRKATWSDELVTELSKHEDKLNPMQAEALNMLQRAQTAKRWQQLKLRARDETEKTRRILQNAVRRAAGGASAGGTEDPLLTEIKEEIHRQLTEAQNQYKWWDLRQEVREWHRDELIEHKVTTQIDGSKKSAKQCNVFSVEVLYEKLFEEDPITCAHMLSPSRKRDRQR